jgi:hypothetical protein
VLLADEITPFLVSRSWSGAGSEALGAPPRKRRRSSPKEAIAMGGAEEILALGQIPAGVLRMVAAPLQRA